MQTGRVRTCGWTSGWTAVTAVRRTRSSTRPPTHPPTHPAIVCVCLPNHANRTGLDLWVDGSDSGAENTFLPSFSQVFIRPSTQTPTHPSSHSPTHPPTHRALVFALLCLTMQTGRAWTSGWTAVTAVRRTHSSHLFLKSLSVHPPKHPPIHPVTRPPTHPPTEHLCLLCSV